MKEKILKRSILRIVLALILVCISVFFVWRRSQNTSLDLTDYRAEIVPPTCTDSGYTLYTHLETGETILQDIVPASGHDFGDWQMVIQPTLLQAGSQSHTCKNCGQTDEALAYLSQPIPILGLEGSLDGIGKKQEVAIQATFRGEETSFESYATLKYQGHSSLHFPKKNYTLKFWKDTQTTEKNKMTFSHWNKENKYILKADYLDPTMSRNLVCADVWAAVVANRESLPEEMTELSNYGAVDGFPTALYLNGAFQGLYNMNLHKDDDLFGMSDEEEHAIVITNDPTAPEAFFRETAAFTETSPWEVEFCGTEDKTWVQDKLNELITFVLESDDETFRTELADYLDVDSAIDYLLSIYVLGLTHHGADELILVCYDADMPWVASLYDMETGFGLNADGTEFLGADVFLPSLQGGQWNSATDNLLWDRLLQNFYPELCQRYTQLRQSIFAPETLRQYVTDFTGAIPEELYTANDSFHEALPPAEEGIAQILAYIDTRIQLTDELFLINEG